RMYHPQFTTDQTLRICISAALASLPQLSFTLHHLPNLQSTLLPIVHLQQPDFLPYRTTSSLTSLPYVLTISHLTTLPPLYHHFYVILPPTYTITVQRHYCTFRSFRIRSESI
ncbi:hypothetical protein CROQUDRAFT_663604, partial [Cronartium quercuum f. sp. fusiforme G11]